MRFLFTITTFQFSRFLFALYKTKNLFTHSRTQLLKWLRHFF